MKSLEDDFKLLEVIARESSLSAGAAHFGIAISSASRRIARLESDLGGRLIINRGGRTYLTGSGEKVLKMSSEILRHMNLIRAEIKAEKDINSVRLITHPAATQIAVRAIQSMRQSDPQVRAEIFTGNSDDVRSAVIEGHADLGISTNGARAPGLISYKLSPLPICLICPRDHFLAAHEFVVMADLDGMAMIQLTGDQDLTRIINRAIKRSSAKLDFAMAIDDHKSIDDAVQKLNLPAIGFTGYAYENLAIPIDETWANQKTYICAKPESERQKLTDFALSTVLDLKKSNKKI